MKKRIYDSEIQNGAFAVRTMSKKAQEGYSGTDTVSVAEYEVFNEKEWEMDGADDDRTSDYKETRYAVIWYKTEITYDLTFEEVEEILESLVYEEEEEENEIEYINEKEYRLSEDDE